MTALPDAPLSPASTRERAWRTRTSVGEVTIAPVRPDADAALLHRWLTDPASHFWQMGEHSLDDVRRYLAALTADPHADGWLASVDDEPTFYLETYDPRHGTLAGVHDPRPGDVGMHVLVSPPPADPAARVRGLTDAAMTATMRFILDGLGAQRVVVEPDVRNAAIAVKNAAAGFRVLREVDLPHKRAALSVCTRGDFAASALDAAPHLRPEPMARAQRHLVAKALAELSHERVLAPEPDGATPVTGEQGVYRVVVDDGRVVYRFHAHHLALEHWVLDEPTLTRHVAGAPAPLDVLDLVLELQPILEIPDDLLPLYLEELASTAASLAYKAHHRGPSADRLVGADLATVEAAMTEGHPGFVANSGRIGLGVREHAAFSPEAAAPVRVLWLAVLRASSHLSLGDGLEEESFYADELGAEQVERFRARLRAEGLDPELYRFMPVHPWQWEHRVAITFAPDVARRDLVLVGEGDDEYRAQQSVRTWLNVSRPDRHYVKVALAVQSMGFLRGLSPAYMRETPAINDWVHGLVADDPELASCGFTILRERAAIGWTGDAFHRTPELNSHRKMLAALWRESPVPLVAPHEDLATLASVLHRDDAGASYVGALVRASGREVGEWVAALLRTYLRPLVHCLLAHDLAFMPHGENVILVLDGHVPVRAFLKDVAEEVVLVSAGAHPEAPPRVRGVIPDEDKPLAILTDVVDGVLRHLAGILHVDGLFPEGEFWGLVGACLDGHLADHPELADAATRVDLRMPEIPNSCLNRLQLRNTLQMVDLTDQASSLIYAGTLRNPIGREG